MKVITAPTELMFTNMVIIRDKFTPLNEEEDNITKLLYLVMVIGMVRLYIELGKGHEA